MIATLQTPTAEDLDALVAARHHDPFSLLGLHRVGREWSLRVFRPYAASVAVRLKSGFAPMKRITPDGKIAGHIVVVVGRDKSGFLLGLGGNQDDADRERSTPANCRWHPG